jgi:hypothetical protein
MKNNKNYSIQEYLKAAEIGEVSMIDAGMYALYLKKTGI